MERRAQLFLRSRQCVDGVPESFSQHFEGVLGEEAEGAVLRYREEAGEASLRFAGDTVELRRSGGGLMFRAGETTLGRYATPCGALPLSVRTDYLCHSVTGEGGKALLRYELLSEGVSLGSFALTVRIAVQGAAAASDDSDL